MKNKALISILLFALVSCSDNFDIDVSFGETESINPGIDDAFASTYKPMESQPILFK